MARHSRRSRRDADADCVELSSEPECSALAEGSATKPRKAPPPRAQIHDPTLRDPETPTEETTEQSAPNESDVEGMLYKLIWSQWVDICPPNERTEHPPRRFVISSELIRTIVQRRVDVPIERLAWVCAMVIGDRAIGMPESTPTSIGATKKANARTAPRRCVPALKRSAGGPRLHYWSLPEGHDRVRTNRLPRHGAFLTRCGRLFVAF